MKLLRKTILLFLLCFVHHSSFAVINKGEVKRNHSVVKKNYILPNRQRIASERRDALLQQNRIVFKEQLSMSDCYKNEIMQAGPRSRQSASDSANAVSEAAPDVEKSTFKALFIVTIISAIALLVTKLIGAKKSGIRRGGYDYGK